MENTRRDRSRQEWAWTNIFFFVVTTIVALAGTPLYLRYCGLSRGELALFAFYMAATGMSITVGYHRLFAHRTFKAHPLIEFLVLFFGAAAFEQSALRWASQHRDHHRYVDTDRDPYSIKKGFFYAHIGWLIFWKHPEHFENARDLQQNPSVAHQHRHYLLWAIGAGILLPLAIGALTGHLLGALIFTVCLRLTVVYHSTFCINSVCHMFGKTPYDLYSTAKDHWLVALLTFGEGYHNFHHRFPSDYRNAVRWYQWDPSKWIIFLLGRLGLAQDLKRISKFRILHAKIAVQNQRARNLIEVRIGKPHWSTVRLALDHYYNEIRDRLMRWEKAAKDYHTVLSQHIDSSTLDIRRAAVMQLKTAKRRFEIARRQWEGFSRHQFELAF